MHKNQWSTSDFDSMSWHDNHVYGFRLVDEKPDHGTADVIFDIDYILEWIGGSPRFEFAERRVITYPTGVQSFYWETDVDWPMGRIEFEAPGFTQVLVGSIHRQPEQSLAPEQRT